MVREVTQRASVLSSASDDLDLIHLDIGAQVPTVTVATTLPAGTNVELVDHNRAKLSDHVVGANGEVSLTISAGLYQLRGPGGFKLTFDLTSPA